MTTDTGLIEKRDNLKRELAIGEYKTLVDVFLERFDRLIRKIIRRSKPLPIWLSTLFLILAVTLIGFGAIFVAGDLDSIRGLGELLGIGHSLGVGFLLRFSLAVLSIVTVIVINQAMGRILVLWRDHILDATESMNSLVEFEDWLRKACNIRLQLIVTIPGGLLISSIVVIINSTSLNAFVGYGFMIEAILTDLFVAAFVYQILMIILLQMVLRRYDLKLFAADPGNSEVISQLSGEFGFFVQFIAVYAAVITLANFSFGMLQVGGIYVVMSLWFPILAMFTENHRSLAGIIRRAKWKTLKEVQDKVEKLQAAKNFEDRETMETINRLLDYHERINKTRNSALDLRALFGLVNSLLLPLLAFLLGNLDLVLQIFGRKP